MIFRVSGGIREIMAATPIFREWKRRGLGKVQVETYWPELFKCSNSVDVAEKEILDCSDSVVDFDMVEWWLKPRPVTETYAIYALRDVRMGNWRYQISPSDEDIFWASSVTGVCLGNVALAGAGVHVDVMDALRADGYDVISLGGMTPLRIAAISCFADLYVGYEGDESAMATTSDVPAVVLCGWMSPEFFRPFRRGIPYETVMPEGCDDVEHCSEKSILGELGKVYGVRCENGMQCQDSHDVGSIIDAVRRVSNV